MLECFLHGMAGQNKLCFLKIFSIHSPALTSHFFEKGRFNHLHLWVNCFCHLMENPLRKQIMEMASKNDYRLLWFHSRQMPRIMTESNTLSHRAFLLLCSCIFPQMHHYVSRVATNAELWDRFHCSKEPSWLWLGEVPFIPWPLPHQVTNFTWNFSGYILVVKSNWRNLRSTYEILRDGVKICVVSQSLVQRECEARGGRRGTNESKPHRARYYFLEA